MKITVKGQQAIVTDDFLVANSVGIYECEFEFDSSWDGYAKNSVWQLNNDEPKESIISNGVAEVPWEVLVNGGFIRVGVYGTKDEKVMPTVWGEKRKVHLGTPTGSIGTEPTPSIYAQILAVATEAKDIAEDVQTEWESVSATAETLPSGSSATASFDDGVFSFGIPQGEKGDRGEDGDTPTFTVTPIVTPTYSGNRITIEIDGSVTIFDVKNGANGAKGEDGVGITDIELTSDYCLEITLSDGTVITTPSIRGEKGETGNGIVSITKTATVGKVDTYTITFTDGTTTTFDVTNGEVTEAQFNPVKAELENIRVGADGTTYSTAGDAVRAIGSDVNDLNDAVFNETSLNVNLELGTLSLSDGSESASNTRARTALMPINNVTLTAENTAKYAFRFYDSNGDFVGAPTIWYNDTNSAETIADNYSNATQMRLVCAYTDDRNLQNSTVLDALEELITYPSKGNSIIAEHYTKLSGRIDSIDSEISEITTVNIPLIWQIGSIGVNNGQDGVSTTRQRTYGYIKYDSNATIELTNGAKYNIFAYDKDKEFLWAFGTWQTDNGNIHDIITAKGKSDASVKYIRFSVAYSDDSAITDVPTLGAYFSLHSTGNMQTVFVDLERTIIPNINVTGLGNCSIRCAKEQSYVDGTAPVIEWFLLEEPNSGRFYYSKDLLNKQYLFTFPYETYKYSFGILQNGDIIACLDADSIATENKSDSNRVNPFVFLASENWSICHEVSFGSSLKPCGWLSNCGFKVLADGSAIFCEYTRQTTYTANVWRLYGDPTDSSNWTITKSFVVTSTDNSTGFKHCHMVMQDFYTGICYMSTGDDNVGSMLYYSDDNGQTWTQLQSPDSDGQVNEYGWITGSEKYCRALTFTFTEDYIYWSSDTPTETYHYLFRVERDDDGIFDFSTVTEIVNLPNVVGASTYGTAYIPELNAILLLERTDVYAQEMDVRMVLLADGSLISLGKLYVTANEQATGANLGFRTRFSEWYPTNGLIHVGFGLRGNHYNNDINHNKGFGNTGTWISGGGLNNINNLSVQVFKTETGYGMKLNTYYL